MATGKTHHKMNHLSANDASVYLKNEDRSKFSIFDNINMNNLGNFYIKEDSLFKKKVDKLNLRFYLETDKFLNHKHEMEKSQDHLFLLLFKQISVYVEEIEKLNVKLREEQKVHNKFKFDEMMNSKKEANDKEVSYYKSTIRHLEKRISETKINEDKLKKENESFKRQVLFYKDKLKLELSARKNEHFGVNAAGNMMTPVSRRFNATSRSKEQKVKFSNLNREDKDDNYFSIVALTEGNKANNPENAATEANPGERNKLAYKKVGKLEKLNSTGKIVKVADKFGDANPKKNKTINFNEETISDVRHTDNGVCSAGMNLTPPRKNMKRRNISAFDGRADKKKNINNTSTMSCKGSLPPANKKPFSRNNKNKTGLAAAGGGKISNTNNNNSIDNKLKKKKGLNSSYENLYTLTMNNKTAEGKYYLMCNILDQLDPPAHTEDNININFNNSTIQNVQVNVDNKDLHEFANLFSECLEEEFDLLLKEEEVLLYLKDNILNNKPEESK